ncbi:hypothetical protein M902_2379 [Bacteriovorax sp. BAL6_X]|uniref:hypothetical protein n=1 Tax=Bacteriovorax sp. BAL6_X TaxID=1201290 RepID=UPI0003867544|nr:hypothetical protein [Bacteriovorax sp. BAL6_X]EPZ52032.1 hypothetical protein M902_2379 [Bacteriovorax sp. BAL6_X]
MKHKKIILSIASLVTINSYAQVDLESLLRRYAHYDIVSYIGDFFGPIKLKNRIISYGFTEYYLEDGKLMSKDQFCFSEYKANIPFQAKTDDKFTRAIEPEVVEMEFMQTNGEILIHRPETPTLLGVELDDYTQDFPTDPNDPRFIDADDDGKPGVTVNLTFKPFVDEELYIARKEIFSYDLKKMKNGILAGTVRDRSQQYIIGASKKDLVTQSNPIQNPDLKKSPIYLIPLKDRDLEIDCDELKIKRKSYFPNRDRSHKGFYRWYEK